MIRLPKDGILLHPPVVRMVAYILVTLTLVMCGVVYFTELPSGNVTDEALTESMRDNYEGYTI